MKKKKKKRGKHKRTIKEIFKLLTKGYLSFAIHSIVLVLYDYEEYVNIVSDNNSVKKVRLFSGQPILETKITYSK